MMNVMTFPREKARSRGRVGGDSQGCFHLFGVQEAFLFTDTKQSEILPWEMDVRRTCVTAYGFCADGGRNQSRWEP